MGKKGKKTKVGKGIVLLIIAVVGFVFCSPYVAMAKEKKFPSHPVAIINPFRLGGGTDIELRNLTPFLQKYLGQPIVIVSKPGGGTTVGSSYAARAKPDGYTLLAGIIVNGILAQEFHGTDYRLQDFEPIYGWSEAATDIIVNYKSPYKTLSDLIAAGKQKRLKAALAGIGDIGHLNTLLFEKITGVGLTMIPYGGGGPASGAVIKGEVDFFNGLTSTSVRFVRAKQIRELVILGPERYEDIPETPTIYELGYKDWPYVPFTRDVLAPPNTPQDRVRILQTAFQKAVDDPEFRAAMKKQGRPVKARTGEDLRRSAQEALDISKEYLPFMKEATKKK
jgi:tripartite-type tricarboxylate transporter receptor subunit TctC